MLLPATNDNKLIRLTIWDVPVTRLVTRQSKLLILCRSMGLNSIMTCLKQFLQWRLRKGLSIAMNLVVSIVDEIIA